MKTKFKLIIIASLAMFFFSCTSIKVFTDYDKNVDFSKYKSFEYYGWADDSDKILNRFDKERIESAFGEELEKRNLSMVEADGDLIVTLYIVVDKKTQQTAQTSGNGGYMGYYGHGPGWGYGPNYSTTTISEYDYEVGTLLISIYDKQSQQLIWEGAGIQTVDENPETRDRNIPKAAQAIMKSFPVAIPQ